MEQSEKIIFGGGCFWCIEAVFMMLQGVISVEPGYAGGTTKNPTYYEVSEGKGGHAEVVQIEYDPRLVKLEDLLTVFFASHDPTTPNRQGADVGPAYRSVILYSNEKQKQVTEKFIADLNASNEMGRPIVTDVEPLVEFYTAEPEHRDYYARMKEMNPYCAVVINPKLEKVQQQFATLLKQQAVNA
jgi:peptide-methionine (S)-S-oxide reductase